MFWKQNKNNENTKKKNTKNYVSELATNLNNSLDSDDILILP